jgi:hypothetical protein
MNALSLRTLLLVLAIILFIISAADDSRREWLPIGLAVLACSFLVAEAGWGRNIARRST